jgi:hypothetical protein
MGFYVVAVVVPHPPVIIVIRIWMMKLSIPTANIASRLTLVLIHISLLEGLVDSFRMRLLSLMKLPIPIDGTRP